MQQYLPDFRGWIKKKGIARSNDSSFALVVASLVPSCPGEAGTQAIASHFLKS